MDANKVTTDTFILVFVPQRDNSNAIFSIEKLETLNELVNTFSNVT